MGRPKGSKNRPKVIPAVVEVKKEEEVKVPVLHGMIGSMAITQPCPVCFYAYADGGWCMDCGWTLPIERLPYGTARSPDQKEK